MRSCQYCYFDYSATVICHLCVSMSPAIRPCQKEDIASLMCTQRWRALTSLHICDSEALILFCMHVSSGYFPVWSNCTILSEMIMIACLQQITVFWIVTLFHFQERKKKEEEIKKQRSKFGVCSFFYITFTLSLSAVVSHFLLLWFINEQGLPILFGGVESTLLWGSQNL